MTSPNPRLQRTRSALLRSPLSRKPLGGRKQVIVSMAIVTLGAADLSGGSGGALKLTVAGPAQVQIGQRLDLRFTATNTGKDGLYFKRPWKWADHGMFVVATGADGSRSVSSTRIFDIDSAYLCTFFKPLFSKDQFSFEESLVIGPEPVWDPKIDPPEDKMGDMLRPHLDLKPGR